MGEKHHLKLGHLEQPQGNIGFELDQEAWSWPSAPQVEMDGGKQVERGLLPTLSKALRSWLGCRKEQAVRSGCEGRPKSF